METGPRPGGEQLLPAVINVNLSGIAPGLSLRLLGEGFVGWSGVRARWRAAKEEGEAVRRRRVEASGEDAGRRAVRDRTINLNNRGCRLAVVGKEEITVRCRHGGIVWREAAEKRRLNKKLDRGG